MNLPVLFAELQAVQKRCGVTCQKGDGCDGQCCRLDLGNGEPSITATESELINQKLRTLDSFTFHEAGNLACKFLSRQGKCKIYEVRPIDCRAHFCADEDMRSAKAADVDALLDKYYAENDHEYLNSVLLSSHLFFGEKSNSEVSPSCSRHQSHKRWGQ
jgi:Fe-S-cluster containining protein